MTIQTHRGSRPDRAMGLWYAAALMLVLGIWALPAGAQTANSADVLARSATGSFEVPIFKSGVIPLGIAPKRISVGNPNIADILILHSRQLYVVGKSLGTTNVVLWDRNNRVFETIEVEVTHDLESLKLKLHQLLPGENIQVHSVQQRIILSGTVSNVKKMAAAKELAFSYLPGCIKPASGFNITDRSKEGPPRVLDTGKQDRGGGSQECKDGSVVNMMQVGGAQQVMLQIKVAEINRTVLKRLDGDLNILNFGNNTQGGAVSGGATFPNEAFEPSGANIPVLPRGSTGLDVPFVGPVIDRFEPNTPTIDATGLFLSHLSGNFFLQAVLDISRRKGLAKILAEPTLTTLTGQSAQFLSGGEFPIPVPQDANTTTIEFKEFGVGVTFLPVVLDSGQINLKLNVSVSELSADNNVTLGVVGSASTFVIPSLTKRAAQSTVELADGQTIGIAGLINDTTREFVDKLPGFGDLPLLGALFRSQEFRSGQTELVIFVTPHLAKPIAPEQVRLPTDRFVPPGDLEFYLLGSLESGTAPETGHANSNIIRNAPGDSKFGHEF